MTAAEKVAAALDRLMDGLVDAAAAGHGLSKSARIALETLCEAMRLAPPRLRVHIARRILDLEVQHGVETPLQYREEVGMALQCYPTELDHLEPFELHVIDGDGESEDGDTNDDRTVTVLRLVREDAT